MIEDTTQAESSPAIPVMEVDRGPLVNLTSDERAEFRRTGEMPKPAAYEQPKQDEDSAPSDTAKEPGAETEDEAEEAEESEEEESENDGEPEPPKKQQEHSDKGKKRNAESRKAQLSAEIQSLLKERDRLRAEVSSAQTKPAESSPARVEPSQPQPTRQKPTAEDKDKDGNPKYATYEDFVEDLADWKAEQRWAKAQREEAATAQARQLQSKVDAARNRYENFDEVMQPALTAIVGDEAVSPTVRAMLNDSEMLPDLLFTIGSSQQELASFIQMAKANPGKALRYIALTESLIREELNGQKQAASESNEKKSPVKPQTSAPKPPSEVGGRAATPGDELAMAAQAGDFRRFKAEATRRYLAQLKG